MAARAGRTVYRKLGKDKLTEKQLETIAAIKKKIKFGNDSSSILTRKELKARKKEALWLVRKGIYQPPQVEILVTKSGDTKETELFYNTKRGDPHYGAVRKFKTVLCRHWPECKYGAKCKYAHGQKELKQYRSVQQCLAEYDLLIKKTNIAHHELCKNQQCPVRLRILLKKTVLCRYHEEGNCYKRNCTYAHGEEDRRPLPKFEFCQNHLRGMCNLKSTECVYAHSRKELRSYGAKKVYPPNKDINGNEESDEYSSSEYSSDEDSSEEESSEEESSGGFGLAELINYVIEVSDKSSDEEEEDAEEIPLCVSCQFLQKNIPPALKSRYFTFLTKGKQKTKRLTKKRDNQT